MLQVIIPFLTDFPLALDGSCMRKAGRAVSGNCCARKSAVRGIVDADTLQRIDIALYF